MSIQTTRDITREEAEELYVKVWLERMRPGLEREAKIFPNQVIEDTIESEFVNYNIVEKKP